MDSKAKFRYLMVSGMEWDVTEWSEMEQNYHSIILSNWKGRKRGLFDGMEWNAFHHIP